MEDPPMETTPEDTAAPIVEPEPPAEETMGETEWTTEGSDDASTGAVVSWETAEQVARADEETSDDFITVNQPVSVNDLEWFDGGEETSNPLEEEGVIAEPIDVLGDATDPFGLGSDTDLVGADDMLEFDDAFAPPAPGEVEDPLSKSFRLSYEAGLTEGLAELTDEDATKLEERAERAERVEERHERRAEELRDLAEEKDQQGRTGRAKQLREAAERREQKAEEAEDRSDKREDRGESLREQADTYRAEAAAMRAEAETLERAAVEEAAAKEAPPAAPTPAAPNPWDDDSTVDYGSMAEPGDTGGIGAAAAESMGGSTGGIGAAAAGEMGQSVGVDGGAPADQIVINKPVSASAVAEMEAAVAEAEAAGAEAQALITQATADTEAAANQAMDLAKAASLEVTTPAPLADLAGRIGDSEVANIMGRIASADLGEAGEEVKAALSEALAAGGSPVEIGREVTERLTEELGPEVGKELGDTVTGALGGLLEGNSDVEKIGNTLLSAVDNVMNGESPVEAVKAALNEAGLGQYGEVAERAIEVAEKIADGDFEGAAEAAGLDDELAPILGGYRAAAGLADGDPAEVGRGLAQAAGYGDHLDTAERLADGDLDGATAAAVKAAGYDQWAAGADNIARGDYAGAAEEAARAGGYGEAYDAGDKLIKGDLEGAAVSGAEAAATLAGIPGGGGVVQNLADGDVGEAAVTGLFVGAGATLGGPIGAKVGEFAAKAFSSIDFEPVGEGIVDAGEAIIEGAGDVIEGAGDVIEGAGEVIVEGAGAVIEALDPTSWFD